MSTRTALITGASRPLGLGFAVARELAGMGYHVFLAARDISQAEARAVALRRAGHAATALRLDLADPACIRTVAEGLAEAIGQLDVLINNATNLPDFRTQSALEVDLDALRTAFEVNVFGCWALVQALLPLLRRAPEARIVNLTSAAAYQIARHDSARLFSPAYSLAKYTLNALTTTLAAALADTPIRVNAVDPGRVATHPERGRDAEDRSPAEAAMGVIWAATLPPGGPTGGLFIDGKPVGSGPG